jgi:GxxExxY protein
VPGMDCENEKIRHKDLSYKMIGLAMQVHRELGFGFLEKVYENAMMVLCRKEIIKAEQQAPITVSFHSETIGQYYADILVDDQIILELKSTDKITDAHRAQALHYLKATDKKLAIILNFGKESLEYERLVS